MKTGWQNPFCILGIVAIWRIAMFFTAQPIPADDAFFFDGAMVNFLLHGHYFNPALSAVFPIAGHQLYAAYPPIYQIALFLWMKIFGASVISAMGLHAALFCGSALLTVWLVVKFFPSAKNHWLAILLLFAVTFDDRPESLAHNFGLISLLLTGKMLRENASWPTAICLALTLWLTLYTSVIVGAFYFGTAFIAVAFSWLRQKNLFLFAPFFLSAILFVAVTFAISKLEPLWWAGFRENARQTPVLAIGFRIPTAFEICKLIRAAPVFLVALAALPFLISRRKEIFSVKESWLALFVGIFVMGWILLIADMTLLAANYVGYVVFTQVLLAAGLFAIGEKFFPRFQIWLRAIIVGCVLLVSIRAIGLTTWGEFCNWKNSYAATHKILLNEFAPFAKTNSAVIVSSAFCYSALAADVQNPIHSDWYFDRANWTKNADVNGLIALHPAKLILVQYDYYRAFVPILKRLDTNAVEIRVRDFAKVKTPDSIPFLTRVLQHVSWAPIVVDLDWKTAATNSAPAR